MVLGVEFEEEQSRYVKPRQNPGGASFVKPEYTVSGNEPSMVKWLLRHGYVKSPTVAHIVLLIVVAINIAITYFVIKTFL